MSKKEQPKSPQAIKANDLHDGMSIEQIEQSMTLKHVEFARKYVLTLDAEKAAADVGYYGRTAYRDLLSNPKIELYIRKLQKQMSDRFKITADTVIQELAKIAFINPQQLYDDNGHLKAPLDLTPNVAAAISEITEEVVGFDKSVEKPLIKRKYKFHSKEGALDKLARHLGLYEKDNAQKSVTNVMFYLPSNGRDPKLDQMRGIDDAQIVNENQHDNEDHSTKP
jgi:phage terminase small subunit